MRVLTDRSIVGAFLLCCLFSQAWAQAIYSCDDGKGRRLTDRMIPECTDREQKELNPSGTVKRRIAPVLTVKERAAEEAKEQQALEERKRLAEEKKRDQALLSRYPDKAAHDKERRAAIALVDEATAAATRRTADLRLERQKLDAELEFYKSNPTKIPARLQRLVEENEHQMDVQRRFVANQESEKKRVNTRFDEELANLERVWSQIGKATSSASAPTPVARIPTSATKPPASAKQ